MMMMMIQHNILNVAGEYNLLGPNECKLKYQYTRVRQQYMNEF